MTTVDSPSSIDKQNITGLILAGGRGSRMQHLDKGLQLLNGQNLVQHVITRLKPQVGALAISANRNVADYAKFGFPVWRDVGVETPSPQDDDFKGPLAGVATGLMHCENTYMLCVPCDSPFLPIDLVARLAGAIGQADIAVVCTGDPAAPQLQPVFCLMKTALRKSVQEYLRCGGRRMDGWYGTAAVVNVHFDDAAAFGNINTLDDLRNYSSLQQDQ